MNLIKRLRHLTPTDWALLAAIFAVTPFFDLTVILLTVLTA